MLIDLCLDLCSRSLLTSKQISAQDSDLSPKSKAFKGRGRPLGDLTPNNSPLLTGLENRYGQKMLFSHRNFTIMGAKMAFSHYTRGSRPLSIVHAPWSPGGTQKSIKKRYEKQVLQRRAQKRSLGLHGAPQGSFLGHLGAQRLPK